MTNKFYEVFGEQKITFKKFCLQIFDLRYLGQLSVVFKRNYTLSNSNVVKMNSKISQIYPIWDRLLKTQVSAKRQTPIRQING